MNKSLLVKLFGSLIAIMLITACNSQTDEKMQQNSKPNSRMILNRRIQRQMIHRKQ